MSHFLSGQKCIPSFLLTENVCPCSIYQKICLLLKLPTLFSVIKLREIFYLSKRHFLFFTIRNLCKVFTLKCSFICMYLFLNNSPSLKQSAVSITFAQIDKVLMLAVNVMMQGVTEGSSAIKKAHFKWLMLG